MFSVVLWLVVPFLSMKRPGRGQQSNCLRGMEQIELYRQTKASKKKNLASLDAASYVEYGKLQVDCPKMVSPAYDELVFGSRQEGMVGNRTAT